MTYIQEDFRGVVVIMVTEGIVDPSSNPERGCLLFT